MALVEPLLSGVKTGEVDPRRVVLIDGQLYVLDIRFRMLKNRELARAMGFDDAESQYEFTGTATEITRQIGNAVPCNLAAALVAAILSPSPAVSEGVA
jgi:DNA (cytosine-5)-methyltransferase 1